MPCGLEHSFEGSSSGGRNVHPSPRTLLYSYSCPLTQTEQLYRTGTSPAKHTWECGQVIGIQMVFEVPGKALGLRWW